MYVDLNRIPTFWLTGHASCRKALSVHFRQLDSEATHLTRRHRDIAYHMSFRDATDWKSAKLMKVSYTLHIGLQASYNRLILGEVQNKPHHTATIIQVIKRWHWNSVVIERMRPKHGRGWSAADARYRSHHDMILYTCTITSCPVPHSINNKNTDK